MKGKFYHYCNFSEYFIIKKSVVIQYYRKTFYYIRKVVQFLKENWNHVNKMIYLAFLDSKEFRNCELLEKNRNSGLESIFASMILML